MSKINNGLINKKINKICYKIDDNEQHEFYLNNFDYNMNSEWRENKIRRKIGKISKKYNSYKNFLDSFHTPDIDFNDEDDIFIFEGINIEDIDLEDLDE